MVQGEKYVASKSLSFDNSHKKGGFEAVQKREEEKRQQAKREQEQKSKYGAWGPVFKDRETFASMHFC